MSRYSVIPSAAMRDTRLSPRDISVLAVVGVFADENGWAYPSIGTLGEILGITRQAVQKSTRLLIALRYMESRKRRRRDGGQTSNMMRVLLDTEHPEEFL